MRFLCFCLLLLLPGARATAQQAAPQGQSASEMESKEAPAKSTSRVNLVPVTVVVRDQESFRLLDNGKPQVISRFSIEKPGAPVVLEKEPVDLEPPPEGKPPEAGAAAAPAVIADHFVAYLFDDVHVKFEDLARARYARATTHLGARLWRGTSQAGYRRCGLLPRSHQGYSADRSHTVFPFGRRQCEHHGGLATGHPEPAL